MNLTTPVDAALPEARASERTPPANTHAEQQLLGAILLNDRTLDQVAESLMPACFFHPAHQRIFDAMLKLRERSFGITATTLRTFFESDSDLSAVGGGEYLHDLERSVVSIVNARDHAQIIRDLYIRRQLIGIGEDIVNDAFDLDIERPANEQIEVAEQSLYNLAESGQAEGGFQSLKIAADRAIDTASAAFQKDSHVTGVTTGLRDLDTKMGGLHPSDLVILAGRPSMGKTALATNIAYNAAHAFMETEGKDGAVVAFFSLEMSSEQLANRVLAEMVQVPSDKIRRGELHQEDFTRFVAAVQSFERMPFYVDDTADISVPGIRTRARRLQRTQNLGLIVIDYLQLLRPSGRRQADNRVQELTEITRGLKAIAKELNVPVVALSQLSRAVENREDKRPQLADLRESGSIEQDADVVAFVYRQQYYEERNPPQQSGDKSDEKFNEEYQRWEDRLDKVRNVAEFIIAKQRHGPIGTVHLHFQPEYTHFTDLETRYDSHGYPAR